MMELMVNLIAGAIILGAAYGGYFLFLRIERKFTAEYNHKIVTRR